MRNKNLNFTISEDDLNVFSEALISSGNSAADFDPKKGFSDEYLEAQPPDIQRYIIKFRLQKIYYFYAKHFAKDLYAHFEDETEKQLAIKSFIKDFHPSQRLCRCYAIPAYKDGKKTAFTGNVQLQDFSAQQNNNQNTEGNNILKYGYYGLASCKSALKCPVCGARVAYYRREEIQQIVKIKITQHKESYIFITHTLTHNKDTDPSQFVDNFQELFKEIKKNREYRQLAEKYGFTDWIKSSEITTDHPLAGYKTGIHWHTHTLQFCKKALTKAEAKNLRDEYAKIICKYAKKMKIITEIEEEKTFKRCVDIELPHLKDKDKKPIENIKEMEKLLDYLSKNVSFEMASVNTKEGRKKQRITHWQLMAYVVNNPQDTKTIDHFMDIMEALTKRHSVRFSEGLRQKLGLASLKDKEIFDGQKAKTVYEFNKNGNVKFSKISSGGHQRKLLHELENQENIAKAVLKFSQGISPSTGEKLPDYDNYNELMTKPNSRKSIPKNDSHMYENDFDMATEQKQDLSFKKAKIISITSYYNFNTNKKYIYDESFSFGTNQEIYSIFM